MSAAHPIARRTLEQAIRQSRACSYGPAALALPDFLVPAFSACSPRPFSSSTIRHAKTRSSRRPANSLRASDILPDYPSKPLKEPLSSRIPIPDFPSRSEIEPWLATLDPFLPSHLRQYSPAAQDLHGHATAFEVATVLTEAQLESHDLLAYMVTRQGRWETALWLVKKLVEDGPAMGQHTSPLGLSAQTLPSDKKLRDLTASPLLVHRVHRPERLAQTLDDVTSAPDSIDVRYSVSKRALGQVWRTLGTLILAAAEASPAEVDPILPHALEIIAYLHHAGLIPASVYAHKRAKDEYALQQPPTLHLLSSKILTALSDASFRAHEASVQDAKKRLNASYFLGYEIPGSRYKVRVTEVAPELWLELVLWSCLHGGWIADGVAIIERMIAQPTTSPWRLVSWLELLQAEEEESAFISHSWWRSEKKQAAEALAKTRARTQKAISSEVVASFVDGLVNNMRVGVGIRGTTPEKLVKQIKSLKELFDRNDLSLGSANWDSIIVRFLESGGVAPERRPELLSSIVQLASGYGSEVAAANAASPAKTSNAEPAFYFEPSATSLGLLHRTIQAHIDNGDMAGAMATLQTLQLYTDHNKQKSMQQFFESLKSLSVRDARPFTGTVPTIDFPAFDPKLPLPLLARLLDLATDMQRHDMGRWLLLSEEIDGPLINPGMYSDPRMAASIIRFATLAKEDDIVFDVVKSAGVYDRRTRQKRLPNTLFSALYTSQLRLHRWESMKKMVTQFRDVADFRPRAEILSHFAAELLRLSNGRDEVSSQKLFCQEAFTDLLSHMQSVISRYLKQELHCILGIMSSVSTEWNAFSSRFLTSSTRQTMTLSTQDFNRILDGVLDGFGSSKGRELVDRWCFQTPKTFESYTAAGGLPTMPQFRIGKAVLYERRPEDIEIKQQSGTKLTIQGRVRPNRQTVWVVLRRLQLEAEERKGQELEPTSEQIEEIRTTLTWATRLLYYLGFDHEEVRRDLGRLVPLAALSEPSGSITQGLQTTDEAAV